MKHHACNCHAVCDLQPCQEEMESCPAQVTSVQNTREILETDQVLLTREAGKGTELYQASLAELSPSFALSILEKAVLNMPRIDPADGQSLWLDHGVIRLASGDPSCLGAVSPAALEQSLKEIFKFLPTSDPGDGGPWLSGGVLMQGSRRKDDC